MSKPRISFTTGSNFWGQGDYEKITILKGKNGKIELESSDPNGAARIRCASSIKMEYNGIQLRFSLKNGRNGEIGVFVIFDNPPPGYFRGKHHNPPLPIKEMFARLKN